MKNIEFIVILELLHKKAVRVLKIRPFKDYLSNTIVSV